MYIRQNITSYSNLVEYLKTISDFFTGNTLVPFSVTASQFDTVPYSVTLSDGENTVIKFTSSTATVINIAIIVNNATIVSGTVSVYSGLGTPLTTDNIAHNMYVQIIKNYNDYNINIGGCNDRFGASNIWVTSYHCTDADGATENYIMANSSNGSEKYAMPSNPNATQLTLRRQRLAPNNASLIISTSGGVPMTRNVSV